MRHAPSPPSGARAVCVLITGPLAPMRTSAQARGHTNHGSDMQTAITQGKLGARIRLHCARTARWSVLARQGSDGDGGECCSADGVDR